MQKYLTSEPPSSSAPTNVHDSAVKLLADNIDDVEIRTTSAQRVKDLVAQYGRPYADGELAHGLRGQTLTGSEIPCFFFFCYN